MTDMSMLSAQCDELRSMSESVGLAMPQAATLMMEAADTIWELRCKCAGMVDMRERARLAETENAKLRELVRDMWFWHYEGHIDSESQERQMKHIDRVIDCMRELGVDE